MRIANYPCIHPSRTSAYNLHSVAVARQGNNLWRRYNVFNYSGPNPPTNCFRGRSLLILLTIHLTVEIILLSVHFKQNVIALPSFVQQGAEVLFKRLKCAFSVSWQSPTPYHFAPPYIVLTARLNVVRNHREVIITTWVNYPGWLVKKLAP